MKEYNSNTYIRTAQLIEDTKELIGVLPPDIDAVAGSARSGLIPATLLSCLLHRPLYAINKGNITLCEAGTRTIRSMPEEVKKVLIVEDTVFSGTTLDRCVNRVHILWPEVEVLRCAVYCTPSSLHKVDFHSAILPPPHYLEWNFFNSSLLDYTAFDFDGIFCKDISAEDDDDRRRYAIAIKNAIPNFYVRNKTIHTIVTARLEKYRDMTLEWMAIHGMSVKNLIMGPWADLRERARNRMSSYKAEKYRESGLRLFVESCPIQAKEIFEITGKPVLCPELGRVLRK